MKRIPLFITLGLFLLLLGSFLTYQYFFKKQTTTIWSLVPEQAVLIYEAGDCEACNEKLGESVISEILRKITLDVQAPDSIINSLKFLSVSKKGKAVSLHVISKNDFDVIYYFTSTQAKQFNAIIDQWRSTKKLKFSERILNGIKIQEFSVGKKLFSCVKLNDAWVGSFTPFLIEDVIRTFESGEQSGFRNEIDEVYALPKIKDDAGNIYVHLGNLINWLNIFPEDTRTDILKLGKAGLLDIKQDDHSITLNGFSLAHPGVTNDLLSYFKNQSPVQFTLKQYISNQTVFATNYGISDGTAFYQSLALSKNKKIQDTLSNLAKIDLPLLFSSFGKEMTVCNLESRGDHLSTIILFETQKPDDWLKAFDQLSKAVEQSDTVFYEKYSTYEIREIEINDFPGKLFQPLISGFSQTYYTQAGNTLILAERLEDLKSFVDDIDQENVWGKSIVFNKFLESTLLESNLSIYVNTSLVWNSVTSKLNVHWRDFITKHQSLLNSLNLGAIQFSHLNESFYTNITWTYEDLPENNASESDGKVNRLVASLSSSIITQPIVVRSHASRDNEVLLQDSAYVLYHLSNDGKVLWQKELGERIVGDVHQVDFFNNGKLQFFFATSKKLHVIDRLGNYVSPYPAEIKIKDLEFVTVVDYDKSKKYRFLLADRSGKLWMLDKETLNLEGWKPKNIEDDVFAAARHHRVRGKDYILAIRKDGYVYLMNRKGENIKGFPLNLDARPSGDYHLETGNSLAATNFVCISRDGFRIKFNLEGKIVSRETLIKPSFETQFSLVPERNEKSYLIMRQDSKRITLLNEDGKEILSNNFLGTNAASVKYYDFGAGKVYISITDLVQDLSFIYDGKGNALFAAPIQGNAVELRLGKGTFPRMFIVDQNTLIIQ